MSIIRRMKAKEEIFCNVLSGERFHGIKRIPALFKGRLSIHDFIKGIVVSFLTLFVPSFFFPELLKGYKLLRRSKNIRF